MNVLKAFRLMMVSFVYDHAQCPTTPCPHFTGKNDKNRFLDTFLFRMVPKTKILKYKCAKGISFNDGFICL